MREPQSEHAISASGRQGHRFARRRGLTTGRICVTGQRVSHPVGRQIVIRHVCDGLEYLELMTRPFSRPEGHTGLQRGASRQTAREFGHQNDITRTKRVSLPRQRLQRSAGVRSEMARGRSQHEMNRARYSNARSDTGDIAQCQRPAGRALHPTTLPME